jgi:hypothetical protein
MWAVVPYLVMFAAGVAAGVAWVAWTLPDPTPLLSGYTYYRGGYHEGHADGVVGIWRGGPLR